MLSKSFWTSHVQAVLQERLNAQVIRTCWEMFLQGFWWFCRSFCNLSPLCAGHSTWSFHVISRRLPKFDPCPFKDTLPQGCRGSVEVFRWWLWWQWNMELCRIAPSWPVQKRNVCTLQWSSGLILHSIVGSCGDPLFNPPKPPPQTMEGSRSGVHPPILVGPHG